MQHPLSFCQHTSACTHNKRWNTSMVLPITSFMTIVPWRRTRMTQLPWHSHSQDHHLIENFLRMGLEERPGWSTPTFYRTPAIPELFGGECKDTYLFKLYPELDSSTVSALCIADFPNLPVYGKFELYNIDRLDLLPTTGCMGQNCSSGNPSWSISSHHYRSRASIIPTLATQTTGDFQMQHWESRLLLQAGIMSQDIDHIWLNHSEWVLYQCCPRWHHLLRLPA